MTKYIITGVWVHPTMNAQQILNAQPTLSTRGTYNEIKEWLENKKHRFIEADIIPEIEHGTIFKFEDNTGIYFTEFVKEGSGKRFEELDNGFLKI